MRKKIWMFALVLSGLGLLGATQSRAALFSHENHNDNYLTKGECRDCHNPAKDKEIVPALDVCKKCHDDKFLDSVTFPGLTTHGSLWSFEHGQKAKHDDQRCKICHNEGNREGAIGCTDCHEAGAADKQGSFSNNMKNVHRGEFMVSHPIAARGNPTLCSSCHAPKFCQDCHEKFKPEVLSVLSHRKGFSNLKIGEATHGNFGVNTCRNCHNDTVLPATAWTKEHRREARRNLATCQACHPEGDVCLKCHSAREGLGVNPHPKDWDDGAASRIRRATNGKTCSKCH